MPFVFAIYHSSVFFWKLSQYRNGKQLRLREKRKDEEQERGDDDDNYVDDDNIGSQ